MLIKIRVKSTQPSANYNGIYVLRHRSRISTNSTPNANSKRNVLWHKNLRGFIPIVVRTFSNTQSSKCALNSFSSEKSKWQNMLRFTPLPFRRRPALLTMWSVSQYKILFPPSRIVCVFSFFDRRITEMSCRKQMRGCRVYPHVFNYLVGVRDREDPVPPFNPSSRPPTLFRQNEIALSTSIWRWFGWSERICSFDADS